MLKQPPFTLFYSYSHQDEKMRNTLSKHLTILQQQKVIREWYDREITAGEEWEEKLLNQLDQADIILLLISVDFVASKYCYSKEMVRALQRHNEGKARVIPIIIRPVDWTGTPFAKLQALPKDAKPVALWTNKEVAWVDVSKGIKLAAQALASGDLPTQSAGPLTFVSTVVRKSKAADKNKNTDELPILKPNRLIYNAKNKITLPGYLVLKEGDKPTGDVSIDRVYDIVGKLFNFFLKVYKRNSIDNKGMAITATVHYDKKYNNAFWTGKQLVFGDGDGEVFNSFATGIDVIGREYANGVIQHQMNLEYWEQSGALRNSIADVFASLAKQYVNNHTTAEADWIIGSELLVEKLKSKGLRSLANPGTAYDNSILGKDPQPSHMRDYVNMSEDSGGVYYNSGIPNKAFFLISSAMGGYAWEKAGLIWYKTICSKTLKKNSKFQDFASATVSTAKGIYGPKSFEAEAVKKGWELVGVIAETGKGQNAAKTKSVARKTSKKSR